MKVSKRCILLFAVLLIISLITLNVDTVSTVLLGVKGTIVDGNLIKFSGTAGVGEDAGVAALNVTKNKFDATIAPTVDNDTDEGYTVGSKWYDVTADEEYVCLDNTNGAAVWLGSTAPGGEFNTASNIGANIEIYKQKTGVDLELRTLSAGSSKILISNTSVPIDVGDAAIDRANSLGSYTIVNVGNPANATGTVTSVEIWALSTLSDVEVATFYVVSGDNLSTRDNEAIGTVTSGSKQTFSVSLNIQEGDYIGIYYSAGTIELDSTGGSGGWYTAGDYIPCTNQAFTLSATWMTSLYGTSTGADLDYIRFNVVESEIRLDDLKATEDNTDLDASTTAHGLLPKLPNVNTQFLDGTGIWAVLDIGDIPLITPAKGGTGVANNAASTITITGAFSLGLTLSANTALTLPTSGTVATTADVDLKANIASPTFTGTVTIPTPFTLGAVSVLPTGTELNYVDGVTSAIQAQIDTKAPTASPTFTGAATFSGSIATPEGTPVNAVAAQGTITMAGIAVADETFVIDSQTFTWKAARSVAGEVTIGADAPAAVTNIVTAVTADLATVTAVDGAGDTVTITAVTKGVAGDSIVFTEASTNMTVDGAGTLGATTAGVDGTVGVANEIVQDATYFYVCIDTNTIADTNWRRIALGSVY